MEKTCGMNPSFMKQKKLIKIEIDRIGDNFAVYRENSRPVVKFGIYGGSHLLRKLLTHSQWVSFVTDEEVRFEIEESRLALVQEIVRKENERQRKRA